LAFICVHSRFTMVQKPLVIPIGRDYLSPVIFAFSIIGTILHAAEPAGCVPTE
jgi:hypothetical protein